VKSGSERGFFRDVIKVGKSQWGFGRTSSGTEVKLLFCLGLRVQWGGGGLWDVLLAREHVSKLTFPV